MDVLYLLQRTWMQHLNALVPLTLADCQNSYQPSAPCMQTLSELDFYRGGGGGGSPEGFYLLLLHCRHAHAPLRSLWASDDSCSLRANTLHYRMLFLHVNSRLLSGQTPNEGGGICKIRWLQVGIGLKTWRISRPPSSVLTSLPAIAP